ncbi:MAG: type I-B CRISPR-associated protein Cas5b [Bacillota bacterium]
MAGVMQVLKAVLTAPTASFRHPLVMIGRLPTYELPPPATVYGLLCAALGEWFAPGDLAFAYTFTHQGVGEDVELAQVLEVKQVKKDKNLGGLPKNVEGSLNPQRREFLLKPRLTLYLKGEPALLQKLQAALFSPRFALLLGRSQDLATCHSARLVELVPESSAFFSHTILPWHLRQFAVVGEPVYMPVTIDYRRLREPVFQRYLQLTRTPLRLWGSDDAAGTEPDVLSRQAFGQLWVDREEKQALGAGELYRGVWFHAWRG